MSDYVTVSSSDEPKPIKAVLTYRGEIVEEVEPGEDGSFMFQAPISWEYAVHFVYPPHPDDDLPPGTIRVSL